MSFIHQNFVVRLRGSKALLASAACAAVLLSPGLAMAQESGSSSGGLEEIVVTAQKREQSLQDVPIAVTAIAGETLQANRVTTVADLSGLAPGFTTSANPGGTNLPQFAMRGASGNGVVPGSDKEISSYLDGVYLGASRGGIFELPDIQRIEVLRGPQGTLFGRNSTAGAVSITTRDPKGEFGVKASATIGNYEQRRFGLTVDLPRMGNFSAFVSYVHNERIGDMRNTAAGQKYDLTSSFVPKIAKVFSSPAHLGDQNSESIFAAVKFESGDFSTVYKFDWLEGKGSPPGTGLVGFAFDTPLLGNLIQTLMQTQAFPVPIASDGKRPDAVANGWNFPTLQRSQGHSLTSTYRFNDHFSVKNILAYRNNSIFGSSPLDGFSGLIVTPQSIAPLATLVAFSTIPGLGQAAPADQAAAIGQVATGLAPLVGSPYVGLGNAVYSRAEQISDEIQFTYNSEQLTATVGGLWYQGKDWTQETRLPSIVVFQPLPGGKVPVTGGGETYNKGTSLAAYAQLEYHLTKQLDIVGGIRITNDKKYGTVTLGATPASSTLLPFNYSKSKPSYLIGVNYKPNDDTLIYAKFSTAFVSGGSTAGIPYEPETVKSIEGGIKADLLDKRLRLDLAVYHAEYKNVQNANSTSTPGSIDYITRITGDPNRWLATGTFVQTFGDLNSTGFELDVTAKPAKQLTMGGSVGYADFKVTRVDPDFALSNGGRWDPNLRPNWTANLWAQFDSPPVGLGDAFVTLRMDARFQSKMDFAINRLDPAYKTFGAAALEAPAYWVVNGRVSLKDLNIRGMKTELAGWVKNLGNQRTASYALPLGVAFSSNYIPARTYGLDLSIQF